MAKAGPQIQVNRPGKSVCRPKYCHPGDNLKLGLPRRYAGPSRCLHVPGWDEENPKGSSTKTIAALDKLLEQEGDEFCALSLELVQGEAGFIFGTKEYYRAVFDWAKKKGSMCGLMKFKHSLGRESFLPFKCLSSMSTLILSPSARALQGAGLLYVQELNPKPGLVAGTFNGPLPGIIMGCELVKYLREGGFYGEGGANE